MSLEAFGKAVLPILTAGISTWWEKRKARKALESQLAGLKEIHPRLLLIVEDNPADVELLQYYLKQANNAHPDRAVEIDVASNTADAWTVFLEKHHHIVLVDMRFPQQGDQGWTLAERMRRHDIRAQIVIVYTMVEDIAKLPSGQIFSFMRKPPTYEGILQLLAKLK